MAKKQQKKSSKASAPKSAKAKSQSKPAPAKKPEPKRQATTKKPVKKEKEKPKKKVAKSPEKKKSKPTKSTKSKSKSSSSSNKSGSAKSKGKAKKGSPKAKGSDKAKSGKKSKGRKKKNKGSTQYQKVKKILLERYKRRCNIDTDKDASLTASNILKWLKINKKLTGKQKVTHRLVKEAVKELFPREERRLGRKLVPDIPDYAQTPNEFYNIEDVIKDIDRGIYRRVWIYSPLILGKRGNGYLFLDGNKSHTYEDTFQGWVDFINEQIKEGNFKEGSPPDVWYRFVDVFWNNRRKRWEVKIIPCDVDGNCFNTGYIIDEDCDTDQTEENYGVNPDDVEAEKKAKEDAEAIGKQAEAEAKNKAEEQKKTEPAPAGESKEVVDAMKKAEAARENDFKVQTLIRVKQSIMEEIKFMKEIGEPYTDQLAKLKEVNSKIDEIWKA